MEQTTAFNELREQFDRQEERILQLVRIIAATNKRMTEITASMAELEKQII